MTDAFYWHPATSILRPDATLQQLRDIVQACGSLSITPEGIAEVLTPAPVLLCATSGSSGAPKLIRRTPASWQASFAVNAKALDLGPDTVLAVLGGPDSSLVLYAVLEAAHHGADILSLQGIRADRQGQALTDHAATVLYATPTQIDQLCRKAVPMPVLQHIMVGGGQVNTATIQAVTALCPQARLTQFYGAAETSFITWSNARTPPGSVGCAYPSVDLRLDAGGEIWVRSPYLFDGYAAGDSPDTRWQDGYLSVGEVGELDTAGNLFILGRKSRMVTIADTNVFPDQIEVWLQARLNAAAAVVALPDPRRGVRLMALVAQHDMPADSDAVLRDCRARFGALASPRLIKGVAELPQLVSGKPDLRALTALALALA